MTEYTTVWAGERGNYLCSDGPSVSMAQRMVMEGEDDPSEKTWEGRGYRPLGGRFRDTVFAVVDGRMSLAQVCDRLESTGPIDMAIIARALVTLVKEGQLHRELVKLGRGRPRWVYWRP